MRVGIDGGTWTNRRGFGRFTRELLAAIADAPRGHEFMVFLDTRAEFDLSMRAVRVTTSQSIDDAATSSSRRSLADLWRMYRAVAREPLDAFFFPAIYSWFPIPWSLPAITGIHDTMADDRPDLAFDSAAQRLAWSAKTRLAIAQSRLVLTVSEHSARAIVRRHGVDRSRIRVVHEAPAAVFTPDPLATPDPSLVVAVGGISPNKNLTALADAIARVPRARLELAGDHTSDGFKSAYTQLRARIDALGIGSRCKFLGYVPDPDLRRLLSAARVLAFPSIEEGFGLPALEAMACGCPVIAARGHALEEVVGDAGLLVDSAGLAAAIDRVLSDDVLHADLRARSLARAAEFSWRRAASQVIDAIEELRP